MSKRIAKRALAPMPWREFVIGFQIATEALDNPRLDEIPPVDPVDPSSKNFHDAQQNIQNDPFLRVVLAVQKHFGEGYEHLGSFLYRFWALLHLVRRGHLSEWISLDSGREFQNFHPAVLLAAAEAKLGDGGRFAPKRFNERVIEIVAEASEDADDE